MQNTVTPDDNGFLHYCCLEVARVAYWCIWTHLEDAKTLEVQDILVPLKNLQTKCISVRNISWLNKLLFVVFVKEKSCSDNRFCLASKLKFYIDAFMYSIILLNLPSIHALCFPFLSSLFPFCTPVDFFFSFSFLFFNLMYFYRGKYWCNLSHCQSLLRLAFSKEAHIQTVPLFLPAS